jgi:hypothetical protein
LACAIAFIINKQKQSDFVAEEVYVADGMALILSFIFLSLRARKGFGPLYYELPCKIIFYFIEQILLKNPGKCLK